MKSWSTWKRRRATRTRPSSWCLVRWVPGQWGRGGHSWPQRSKCPGLPRGGQRQEEETVALQRLSSPRAGVPPTASPPCHPPGSQPWSQRVQPRFGLGLGSALKRERALPVFLCAPWCGCFLLLQQKSLSSHKLALAVVGGEWMGCQKKKKKAPIQRPTCSCLHKTDTLAKAFSLPAPVASTASLPPRPPSTPRSSSCHLESWLASLLLDVCLPGVASLEAGGCGMAEAGGREPGINSSPRTNTVQLSQPPHLLLRLPSKPCLGSREVRQAHGSPLHVFHSENPGLLVGHLFTSHSIRRHAIKTRGRFLGPFELHSVPLFPSTEGLTAQLRGGETPSCAEKLTQGQDSQGYRAGMLLVHQLRALGWQILHAGEKVPEALSPARLYWLNTTEGMILAHSASHFYSHRNDASS